MKYDKPPLTFEAQADLLLSRGLTADRDILIMRLKSVSYYRLSGYVYPFRESDDVIKEGTTLDKIWDHYLFDRQLRIVVMDAIERVEVAVRTHLAYHFAHTHGVFGYVDPSNFPALLPTDHKRWIDELEKESNRSREVFVGNFKTKYDEEKNLPIWMLIEVMSFGKTLTFYRGVGRSLGRKVAEIFQIPEKVLLSWLKSLNEVRNICAHHGRLWNREFGYKPLLPYEEKSPEWHEKPELQRGRIFLRLTMLKYLLGRCASTSKWEGRLKTLLIENPDISISAMGFPKEWEDRLLWK